MDKFPEELKKIDNWLLAGPDANRKMKAPYTLQNGMPMMAKWKEDGAACLLQYGKAVLASQTFKYGLGLLLRETDGYTIIDFDIKDVRNEPDPAKHTTPERLATIRQIIGWLDSYTEYSLSGVGFHVVVRGSIGRGMRHGDIEIYSRERFIVCTGNVFLDKPIADRQEALGEIVKSFPRKQIAEGKSLVETDATETDLEILNSLGNAANGEKFRRLWAGNFVNGETNLSLGLRPDGHPEANLLDGSLIDHSIIQSLAWRTTCNAQVRRLFSQSPLSKRAWQAAAERNKHKHWDRDGTFSPRHVDMCLYTLRPLLEREQAARQADIASVQVDIAKLSQVVAEYKETPIAQVSLESLAEAFANGATDTSGFGVPEINWPPGLVGDIAKYIYGTANKPVKEVAIVAALGFMAGISGRAFQLTRTGINLFLILVARSGVGKDAMHTGIDDIIRQMEPICPEISKFVQRSEFASGQALMKSFSDWACFLKPIDEFSGLLERISMGKTDAIASFWNTQLTVLFQKSGIRSSYGGALHSDKVNNTTGVQGASLTIVGDTQPTSFYNCLTEQMVANGFLSRFLVIEYTGQREPTNWEADARIRAGLSQQIKDKLQTIVGIAVRCQENTDTTSVTFSQDAMQMLYKIDRLADDVINAQGDNEGNRQRWNRFKELIERCSAVLAASDSPLAPIVETNHMQWALDLVVRNIIMFDRHKVAGNIGADDATRQDKLLSMVKDFVFGKINGDTYGISPVMQKDFVFTKRMFDIRGRRMNCFTTHRMGAALAIDMTIKNLLSNGYIVAVSEMESKETYGYRGLLYRASSDLVPIKSAIQFTANPL